MVDIQSKGFTGTKVAEYPASSLMNTINDGYLHISIISLSANVLSAIDWFPGNFTEITLPQADITVSNVTAVNSNEVSVSITYRINTLLV